MARHLKAQKKHDTTQKLLTLGGNKSQRSNTEDAIEDVLIAGLGRCTLKILAGVLIVACLPDEGLVLTTIAQLFESMGSSLISTTWLLGALQYYPNRIKRWLSMEQRLQVQSHH
jgi:hypothetical protein